MLVILLFRLMTDLFVLERFTELPAFREYLVGVTGFGFLTFSIAGSLVTLLSSSVAIFFIFVVENLDLLFLSTGTFS